MNPSPEFMQRYQQVKDVAKQRLCLEVSSTIDDIFAFFMTEFRGQPMPWPPVLGQSSQFHHSPNVYDYQNGAITIGPPGWMATSAASMLSTYQTRDHSSFANSNNYLASATQTILQMDSVHHIEPMATLPFPNGEIALTSPSKNDRKLANCSNAFNGGHRCNESDSDCHCDQCVSDRIVQSTVPENAYDIDNIGEQLANAENTSIDGSSNGTTYQQPTNSVFDSQNVSNQVATKNETNEQIVSSHVDQKVSESVSSKKRSFHESHAVLMIHKKSRPILNKASLSPRESSMTELVPKTFGCKLCPKRFVTRQGALRHIRTAHLMISPFLSAKEVNRLLNTGQVPSPGQFLDVKTVHQLIGMVGENERGIDAQDEPLEHQSEISEGPLQNKTLANSVLPSSTTNTSNLSQPNQAPKNETSSLPAQKAIKPPKKRQRKKPTPDMDASPSANTYKIIKLNCGINNCTEEFYQIDNQSSKDLLHQHWLDSHQVLPHQCFVEDCDRSFSEMRSLYNHIEAVHSNITQWKCAKCDTRMSNYCDLNRHVFYHHQTGYFSCSRMNCFFMSFNRAGVMKHEGEHRTGRQSIVAKARQKEFVTISTKCSQIGCLSAFENENEYLLHMLQVHGIKEFQCLHSKCHKSFDSRSQLEDHIRASHDNDREWKCLVCMQQTRSHSGLYKHVFLHHHEGLYRCTYDQCQFIANFRIDVVEHHYKIHTENCHKSRGMSMPTSTPVEYSHGARLQDRTSLSYETSTSAQFPAQLMSASEPSYYVNSFTQTPHVPFYRKPHQH